MLRPKQYEKLKSILPGHKNSICFCNCDGEEDAECNILQSIIGYNLLKKLICNGEFKPEDCCILSYYEAQTKHLRTYGHSLGYAGKLMREYMKKKIKINLKTICVEALKKYNSTAQPFDLNKVLIDNINAVEGQEKKMCHNINYSM